MNLNLFNRDNMDTSDITAIVATHERSLSLNKMITSFREYYPKLEIIVADSSRNPKIRNDIVHILTNWDSWISKNRNIAIKNVKTDLVILLDDDYICTPKTDIIKLADNIIYNDDIVLSWWNVNNIGHEKYYFHGYYEIIDNILFHFVDKKNPLSDNYETIFNFFVWKTDDIKKIWWWDNNLKYAREHDDFFLNLKDKWKKIIYDPSICVDHYLYEKYHGWEKADKCLKNFLWKRNIKNKVEIRLIEKDIENKYISYHNCIIIDNNIKKNIINKIQNKYWNYPIKISNPNGE